VELVLDDELLEAVERYGQETKAVDVPVSQPKQGLLE
jgi:hypothetical protein